MTSSAPSNLRTTPPSRIAATPFVWRDPATLECRRWIYDHHYIRRFVSATVAPGGVGKSTLVLIEALAMVTGRDLLGRRPDERCRVWLWNGEDPIDEMQRRIAAAMLHFGIDADEVEGRLFLNSGRLDPICIGIQGRDGVSIATPVVRAMTETIQENAIDVVIIDPFVASHQVTENDNNSIDRVAKTWARIADETNTAIELVHHSRKTDGAETTVEDGRGASALLAAVRSARVLNVMSKEDAEKAEVVDRFGYVRVDIGKANLTPRSTATQWLQKISVPLGNGPHRTDGDRVGVLAPWSMPNAFDGITTTDLEAVIDKVKTGRWRKDFRSKEWVGIAVADALGMDPNTTSDKARIRRLVDTWLKSGALVVVEGVDEQRKPKEFVEAGLCAS